MQIISGSSNKELSSNIAKETGFEMLRTKIDNFGDGELRVQVLDKIGKDVAIIQSTNAPVNNHLMELLLLIDTAKCAGSTTITAVIPYFGYSRQDRCTYQYGPISANLVVRMIEAAGATKIITMDLHSGQIEGKFNIPIENFSTENIFFPALKNKKNIVIVSPDIGGVKRAKNYSKVLGCKLAVIDKIRDINNAVSMHTITGDILDKNCIIVDDIVDSADTLCMATELLLKNGAKSVEVVITHAVLSSGAIQKIMDSPLKTIYISDSIRHENLPEKFKIFEIYKLVGDALK
jgi:ribose-phosphate pyrophosphokinase